MVFRSGTPQIMPERKQDIYFTSILRTVPSVILTTFTPFRSVCDLTPESVQMLSTSAPAVPLKLSMASVTG